MSNYIDGFVFPLPAEHLDTYKDVAENVADIWKEHGAISYHEFVRDDLNLKGTRSFTEILDLKEDEVVVFGWVVFPSKEVREVANERVPNDPRMTDLLAAIMNPEKLIFNAERMVYGGFRPLIISD